MQSFMSQLPISPILPNVVEQLSKHDRLVLEAEPGAGKSTAVPLYLLQHLDLAGKKMVMLEPRRLAARSIAEFLASLLGEKVGETVGYQVRNDRKVSPKTRLEIVTEGVLSNRILKDPELRETGLIIFDEFHERSIHADFGLSLCMDVRAAYHEDLKILVMSATMDAATVCEFLDGAPSLFTEGRCFPVATFYLDNPIRSTHSRDWLPVLNKLIVTAVVESEGDVLVFLPGQREITQTQRWLEERLDQTHTVVVPLYGGLNAKQQQLAIKPDQKGRQKVVLATNIAETSLTLANMTAVVDSGWERAAHYDVTSGMTRLITQRISNASAEQRQGRAGRLQAGKCYRLWTESQQQALRPFSAEEITTTDLCALRLAMAQWGAKSRDDMMWLTPPPTAHYQAATTLLQNLALLDDDLTPSMLGEQSAKLNTEPRFARVLLKSVDLPKSSQSLACDLVAVLMDSHFYQDPQDADLVSRLLAIQRYRESPKQAQRDYPIKGNVSQQILQSAQRFQRYLGLDHACTHTLNDLQTQLGRLVCLAYPDRISKRRSSSTVNDESTYLLANGRGAKLAQTNRLKAAEWLAIADLDGQKSDGRIYLAVEVAQTDVEKAVGLQERAEYRYNKNSHRIEGVMQRRVGAIVVNQSALSQPDRTQLQACLKQVIIDSELAVLPWTKKTRGWLQRVNWLKATATQETADWPDMSREGLVHRIDQWLMPYLSDIDSIHALQRIEMDALLKANFDYALLAEIDKQAPVFYQPPFGQPVAIDYSLGQLPKVSLVLQSVFGEKASPQLAWGQTKLTFELLSPARRPIQVTSDLAGFWQRSYFDVAKEMKGRYPKHRWPENPENETPGKSVKSRV